MKTQSIAPAHISIIVITLLAFVVRITFVEDRNLTIDEASSLKAIAGRSILEIATNYHTNIHLLVAILARLIDYGGHWLTFYRAPSLIFGTLVIPLTYQVGRRMLTEVAGLTAALLLAVAPFHVDFSIQMRGYVTMTFWATVVYYCVWQGLTRARLRYWSGFVLGSVLAVYAHLFGALAVGAGWLIVGGTYLIRRRRKQQPSWGKSMLVSLSVTVGCLALLYGPIFGRIVKTPLVETKWRTQIEPLITEDSLNVDALADYLKVLRLYGPIGEPNSWFVISFVVLAGIGLAATWAGFWPRNGGRAALYLAIWIVAPMLVTSFGLQFITGFYVFRRFFLFFQPLYLLLMAGGILAVGRLAGLWSGRAVIGRGVTICLLILALGGAGWKLYHQTAEDIDSRWRQVAQTILAQGDNPLVICEVQGQRMQPNAVHRDECLRNLEFYLQPALGEPVPWLHQEIDQIATIPGATKLPQLEGQAGDVWLVIWQREWPSTWPALQQTPRLPGLNYYSIGSTLLIHAPQKPVQLLALAASVDALIPLETTPQDRFSYFMSQAQMKAVIGDREAARAAWLAARELSPEGIDAPNRLKAVAELIGMTDLIADGE